MTDTDKLREIHKILEAVYERAKASLSAGRPMVTGLEVITDEEIWSIYILAGGQPSSTS
jgi:hypothetical protein